MAISETKKLQVNFRELRGIWTKLIKFRKVGSMFRNRVRAPAAGRSRHCAMWRGGGIRCIASALQLTEKLINSHSEPCTFNGQTLE